jgi:adenylate kinase family enzyme
MVGIVLVGQSNSGKSAIGRQVASKFGMRYISSGDIARSMNDIQDSLNSGEMAPEDRMRNAVLRSIASCNMSYILDGFPRFYEQYEWLRGAVNHKLVFIYIYVPINDILKRARLRGRDDDNSIGRKIEYFGENTFPMINKIFACGLYDIHSVYNGNDIKFLDSVNMVCRIVEGYVNADNSKV